MFVSCMWLLIDSRKLFSAKWKMSVKNVRWNLRGHESLRLTGLLQIAGCLFSLPRIMSSEKSPHEADKNYFNDLVLSSIRQKTLNCHFNGFTRVAFYSLHRWRCVWNKQNIFVSPTLLATSLVPVFYLSHLNPRVNGPGGVKENY